MDERLGTTGIEELTVHTPGMVKWLALAIVALGFTAWAEEAGDPAEALAAESTAYCRETAKDADKLTPRLIIEKVNEAAKLIEAKGREAFPAFKGKDSPFIFCGTYMWINDVGGTMQMHPIKHRLEGNRLLALRDKRGKLFFAEFVQVATEYGSGWVEYFWPKPGAKTVSRKTSFVKLAEHGDEKFVIGCGVYDWSRDDVLTWLAE